MKTKIQVFLLLFFVSFAFSQYKKQYKINTIAFYNLENLFDTIDNPLKKDEHSPILKLKSNKTEAYFKKIDNMAKVIAEIGKNKTGQSPAIIGVCEIENSSVLDDLLKSKYLKNKHYNYVHKESRDWRGIDVALLYNENVFSILDYKTYELKAWNNKGYRVRTRDQLLVSGYLDNELIHIIVNHWPSQRGGATKTQYLRDESARLNLKIIEDLYFEYASPKIISLGDYNDNPDAQSFVVLGSKSNKDILKTGNLYNPFSKMFKRGFATLGFRDNINLFDQIILSDNLIASNKNYKTYKFYQANIFNPSYLTSKKGRYKGYPFRSWSNNTFTGGYSDHYPVYVYLIKEK